MEKHSTKKGNLSITLSTYLYLLFDRGVTIQNAQINTLCEDIKNSLNQPTVADVVSNIMHNIGSEVHFNESDVTEFVKNSGQPVNAWRNRDPFDIGKELVSLIENTLGESSDVNNTVSWLQSVVPEITDGWSDSENQTVLQTIRKYEFSRGLRWICKIADRTEQGLEEIWVLVEKVTDSVLCMDPYPWDDVDEEFELELQNFLVRWELCGSTAIHLP